MSNDFEKFNSLLLLRTLLQQVSERLRAANVHFGHGTDNADDEAILLVLFGLGLPSECDISELDRPVASGDAQHVMDLVEHRIDARVPAAYLTGNAWFAGLEFFADRRALVPRSPIAELVERGFAPWRKADDIRQVLDLCCGGGCIGIAAAYYLPEAQVSLADISIEALELAQKNIERHSLSDRVKIFHADLFQLVSQGKPLPAAGFDIIVSNPPYVDADDMASMPAEYRVEPELALQAGKDGLDLVRPLLAQAGQYLRKDGLLIVEVGNSAAALERAFPQVPFTWLEFSRGGDGVFLLGKQELEQHFPL